ncbi:MAG: serine hydrolase [Clostridia bacterium]|nr:serine hydrolase [Clostridia bacterium]
MKYPNPTFLNKASDIRYKRGRLTIIIVTCLVVLLTAVLFVAKISSMQDYYREKYPNLVGAATSEENAADFTIKDYDAIASDNMTETSAATSVETTETTALGPIIAETTPEVTTEESTTATQNNSPDRLENEENIYFSNYYPLQTISHEDRDMALDVLKQEISDYIKEHPEERIAFRYVNLNSNEALGCNDLEIILPSASYILPIEMLYYEGIAQGTYSSTEVRTYQGDAILGGRSYIADNYEPGKQFYMQNLAALAIKNNDYLAIKYLLDYMGGISTISSSLSEMSGYIDYSETYTYEDYNGDTIKSSNTSSCYDMVQYMQIFYYNYLRSSSTYQQLLNDLANSNMSSGINNIFSKDTNNLTLNVTGTDDERHAYFAMTLVDGEEPFIVAIYSECASSDRAGVIQSDLSTYLLRFISNCHK